eukprot:12662025-Ditylum_brightwellii.AAC.1
MYTKILLGLRSGSAFFVPAAGVPFFFRFKLDDDVPEARKVLDDDLNVVKGGVAARVSNERYLHTGRFVLHKRNKEYKKMTSVSFV